MILLVFLAVITPVQAQRRGNPAWTTFNNELLSSDVRTLLVDQSGALWFGTQEGLNYFNGLWHAYTVEDGLPAGEVKALTQGPDGTIWVGTDTGLAYSVQDSASSILSWQLISEPALPSGANALWASDSGDLWIGSNEGAGYLAKGQWTPVISGEAITALTGDPDGEILLGGRTVYAYGLETEEIRELPTDPYTDIQVLLVEPASGDSPKTIWAGTDGYGLLSHSGHGWIQFWHSPGPEEFEGIASNEVLALAMDSTGTLWIGTNGGGISLFAPSGLDERWGGGYWHTLSTQDGLAANAVAAISFDQDAVAWIGTIGGVSRYDSQTWQTLVSPDLPAKLDVITALQDSTGALWLGTEGAGLARFDGRTVQRLTTDNSGLTEDYVRTLAEDQQGNLWIGTARHGLVQAPLIGVDDLSTVKSSSWQRFGADKLGSDILRAVAAGADGSLWFGTLDGLTRLKPAASPDEEAVWEHFGVEDGLISNQINQNALVIDALGRVWVGTRSGLSQFDPASEQWRTYTTKDGLPSNRILSLAAMKSCHEENRIWVGANNGTVSQYDPKSDRWTPFYSQSALVYALLVGECNILWIGTAGGLTRYNLANGLNQHFTHADGLVDNEIRTLIAGENRSIWVGTGAGVSHHQPLDGAPLVTVTTINGRQAFYQRIEVLEGESVAISYQGGDLLDSSDQLLYRTRLGTDGEWEASRQTQKVYPQLARGAYEFQVEAWDSSLNASEPATLILNVRPTIALPFVGLTPQPQALSILGLIFLAVAGGGASVYLSTRTRRRRREAVKRRFNPYVSGEPVTDRDMFYGRSDILGKILNTLHENSIMIHGERRIGKTSLLHQLAGELQRDNDPEYLFVPVYVDLEGTRQELLFYALMDEIRREASRYLSEMNALRFDSMTGADYHDREFSRDLSQLLKELAATTKKKVRLILLLDEMDVMNDYDHVVQQQLRRIFMRTFAGNLGAVVAGIEISKEWDRVESPWFNLFNEIELGPISDEEARRLILEPVKGVYSFTPEAVEAIISESQGRPFYIQQHCLEAVNSMLEAGRTQVVIEDVETALDIITSNRSTQHEGLKASG